MIHGFINFLKQLIFEKAPNRKIDRIEELEDDVRRVHFEDGIYSDVKTFTKDQVDKIDEIRKNMHR